MEKSKLDLNKLSDDELDEIIAGLEEQDKKAAEDEIPMAEGMAREAFSQFVPGGQWLEAKARSLVGPETMDEELAMVRGRQKQFQEESPRAAFLGGTAGALGQVGAATALLGPVGAAASLAGRFGLGATEQALQAGVGEGLSAEETAKRALIGGATEAVLPILPSSFQKGLAAGTLITGAVSPEDIGTGALAGGLTGSGLKISGKIASPFIKRSLTKLISKSAGVENSAKEVSNWLASISMGGNLKTLGEVTGKKAKDIDIRELKTRQQRIGRQALEEGLVNPNKTKLDTLKEIGGDWSKEYDLSLLGTGKIDGIDFPVAPVGKNKREGVVTGRIEKLVNHVDSMIEDFDSTYANLTNKKGKINASEFLNRSFKEIDERIRLGDLTVDEANSVKEYMAKKFNVVEKKVEIPAPEEKNVPDIIPEERLVNFQEYLPTNQFLRKLFEFRVYGEKIAKESFGIDLGDSLGEISKKMKKPEVPSKTSHPLPKQKYKSIFVPEKESYSLTEWNKEKKDLGSSLYTKEFMNDPGSDAKKEAVLAIYRNMKKTLIDSIDATQDSLEEQLGHSLPRNFAEDIEIANQSASKLIEVAGILSTHEVSREMQSPFVKGIKFGLSPTIAGGIGLGLGGGPVGSLLAGAGVLGAQQYVKNKLPQQAALALNGAKVPKTVKDIITYKDLIATKIVLSGNMPLASQFLSAANNNNEADIEKMMPLISNEHPDIFPSTEYKSEYIDSQGQRKVTDSVDKEIIRNQIRADENMSNHEKAMKAQKLNKSGVIDGPKQAPNQLMLESMKYFKRPGGSEYLKMLQDRMNKPSDLNPTAKKKTSGVDDFMNRLQETHLEKLQRLAREKKGQ